jgi:hypothetical protein
VNLHPAIQTAKYAKYALLDSFKFAIEEPIVLESFYDPAKTW